jgi:signal transduction histidine kinase/CheY-like chemotaxis protein
VVVNNPGSLRTLLSLAARLAALAGAAGLLFGAWVVAARVELAQAGRQASRQATLAAQGVAAGVDATLARFAEQAQAVRPADLATADRVEQTARLLRLQTLLPTAATFMVAADGKLLAASAPFVRADALVGDAPWFQRALAAPPGSLLPQRLETTWLGVSSGLLLTHLVSDASGRLAGLVGAVLPAASIRSLISPDWLAPRASLNLVGSAGATLLPDAPDQAGALQAGAEATPEDWVQSRLETLATRLGQPETRTATAPLHTIDAAVAATLTTRVALPDQTLRSPVIVTGCALLMAWLVGVLLVLAVWRRPRARAVPSGFGADWECCLDAAGIVVAQHGSLPDMLRRSIGRPLLPVPGAHDECSAASEIAAAVQRRTSLKDVQVPIGDRVWRISLVPAADDGFVCTGRDVTGETTALALRDAAEAAVVEARRSQDRLLTSLGHDIRTPMTSIMGVCELLLDGALEQEQRMWLERMQGSCGALLGMLNGLLAASEDETARGALVCEPVDVSALVQEVAELLRPQALDKALELHTRCDDLLRGQWLADASRLRQVVFNLASNAVKYTVRGRVEIRASAVEADGQTRLRIAVSDTGPGIDPSEREEIFERFRRGRAHGGTMQGGLGLGLALCRENALVMGGSIALESALGVGSEFTFECPAERVPVQDRVPPFAGRTALIVADDGPAVRALAAQLGELGLIVETAPDGYLGLALAERLEAQRGAVDLVVLQGDLPGMPGEVFVIRLRHTAFGKRTAVVWVGPGVGTAEVDGIVPASPDLYQVAIVANQLLAQRPSLDALMPHVSLARGARILLVEDDSANRTLLAAALVRRGFAAFTAGDGEEALRLAGQNSFDAVLMDLQMPGVDGFETAQRMRALPGHPATVPLVALTALQGAGLRQRCVDAGFTSVMEKPVNLDRLTACLRRVIGRALPPKGGVAEFVGDVSQAYLEEMVAVVGIERARACVAEFIADAKIRCPHFRELMPGWEVEAILRCCEAFGRRAETCGAFGLGELLEEIADAATRNDRTTAGTLVTRLDVLVERLPAAMAACLDDIERRWSRGSKAA